LLSLRKPLEQVKDRDALARLWMNLAVCDLRRREPSIARHWLNRAIEAFRARGMRSEIVRARWCGAKVTLLEQDRPKALRELRSAKREFEKLQMPLDAGFVSLDLLGELVGESTTDAEAVKLARSLVDLFARAGVVVSAAHAAQMLRDAVVGGAVTGEYVAYTSRYIARSFVFPEDPFEPPSRGRG
jgi:hypothetical protein